MMSLDLLDFYKFPILAFKEGNSGQFGQPKELEGCMVPSLVDVFLVHILVPVLIQAVAQELINHHSTFSAL